MTACGNFKEVVLFQYEQKENGSDPTQSNTPLSVSVNSNYKPIFEINTYFLKTTGNRKQTDTRKVATTDL